MNKKNWYCSLSLADDKYITEAHPEGVIKPQKSKIIAQVVAACACIALIIGNLWLFIPFSTTPPDVSRYADSEYYGLIQKLNVLMFRQPEKKNNAEKLLSGLMNSLLDRDTLFPPTQENVPTEEDNATGSYKEITDNQVSGIIEADRIKRSDTHIYYLDNYVLRIYEIDKENTKEVGNYVLYGNGDNYYLDQWEFYLSSDCKTVTVITQYYNKAENNFGRCVDLISLDVSDPANVVKKEEFSITGSYVSSRMTNGSILLITDFVIMSDEIDFGNEATFLPQIDEGKGPYSIPAKDIVSPETLNTSRYTVVTKLDQSTLDLKGTAAYLSYSKNIYVSENNVFLAHEFSESVLDENGTTTRNAMTEISCLAYAGESFERKASIAIRGLVKDQWSMDEYEGILRVFTTTHTTKTRKQAYYIVDDGLTDPMPTSTSQTNASLYCIDLSTFEVVASVVDFAPPREEIQSVRFDKETAYVCTSIEMSDPVFFFDLSDLNNITYKDTGTIEGFSTSLINLGNGYLLGIGRGGSWSSFKVEVYEETETGVRSVCSYEIERAEYSTKYKSYYVDRENQLIGVGIVDYSYFENDKFSNEANRYIVLHFDGYELVELVNVPLAGELANKRGAYIDGYMYMFGSEDFKVEKVFN